MIAGFRGTGKTFFSLSCALALAQGGTFLGFDIPTPRSVLYVDGEMDPADLQARAIAQQAGFEDTGNGCGHPDLAFLSHAVFKNGLPDLASADNPAGRQRVEDELSGKDVLFLDNLSSLCRTGVENDAGSWEVMQNWLIGLRRKGYAIIMVHHTGKPRETGESGDQRGTSKREDILNTSIALRPKSGTKGGEFKTAFTKMRGRVKPDPISTVLNWSEEDGKAWLSCTLGTIPDPPK